MKKWLLPLLIVFLISLPGIWELFQPGYYTSHDGEGHVIRMDEFHKAFVEGNFPVRWSKRLFFGYGYPFFNFNYPSLYYSGLPFMLVGLNATWAMKWVTILSFVLSGFFMWLYLRRKVTFPYTLLGTVIYLYAPYRMLNIYVRGSVAETMSLLFPPLLLWGAEVLAENRKRSIWWVALILFGVGISHNISALLFFALFFGYLFFLSIGKRSIAPLLRGGVSFVLGLCASAFFFVPALLEKNITLLNKTIAKDYPDHFLEIWQLLRNGWDFGSSVKGTADGLSFHVGWIQFGLLCLTLVGMAIWFFRRSKVKQSGLKHSTILLYGLTVLAGATFFMLPPSKVFWDTLPLLPFVQFPWRFIMLTVPMLAVVGAVGFAQLSEQVRVLQSLRWILVIALVGVTIYFAKDTWHINQVIFPKQVAGDALEGSTTWADEQATMWFTPKPSKTPDVKVEFKNNRAEVDIFEWKTARHVYAVLAPEPTTVVENTMYYPGWRVWVNETEVPINYQDQSAPGRIVFEMPAGTNQVTTRFTETPLRQGMNILSLVTLSAIAFNLLRPQKKVSAKAKPRSPR